jgi:hypothetical protein
VSVGHSFGIWCGKVWESFDNTGLRSRGKGKGKSERSEEGRRGRSGKTREASNEKEAYEW